jgi:formylglycine-generating enzyme
MTGDGMERRVLISHATDDPEWTPDQVEAVASAIQQAGIHVSLDLWHQRDFLRHLSLDEWRDWMDESIDAATHILCLTSARYVELWRRKRDVQGGFGLAFESIRLVHHLYLLKQRNDGRILTLRPNGRGYDCIPHDLALNCPPYCWVADRAMLLSHVGDAPLPLRASPPEVPLAPALPVIPPAVPPSATWEPAQVAHTPSTVALPRLPWASDSGEDRYGRWADLTVNGVTQRMRYIEPSGPEGFLLGAPQAERDAISHKGVRDWARGHEHEPHKEYFDTGFWLADTPCTQGLWQAVTGNNPSYFKQGADAPERPVENVSWDDVMKQFIARFAATPDWGTGNALCLPTEVEWEYAARAGKCTAYWWGNDWDATRGNADVTGKRKLEDPEGTTPVQRYSPNLWGLYDVHGNVWEWCSDVWRLRQDVSVAWPDESRRVVRGGSWLFPPGCARAAVRDGRPRRFARQHLGFRFALKPPNA